MRIYFYPLYSTNTSFSVVASFFLLLLQLLFLQPLPLLLLLLLLLLLSLLLLLLFQHTTADSRNATLTTISTCFDYAFAKPTTFDTRFATFISTFDDWSDNACRLKHNQVGKFE